MEFSSPSLKIIGFFRGLSKESFFCSLNIMTGAQASVLAMSVRFGREQASLTSEFLIIERFFASKTTLVASRMVALQSLLALFIGSLSLHTTSVNKNHSLARIYSILLR